MTKDANKIASHRGMAIAKNKAFEIFQSPGGVKDCPYKSKSWRSCFCKEMERLQQVNLL